MVQGRDVVHGEDLLVGDVAEHRDLGRDGRREGVRAAACDLQERAQPSARRAWKGVEGGGGRGRTRSGTRPRPRRSRMDAWVGLVLSSPLIDGTSETWRSAKLSLPTRNWNWRMASTNGADSMSPTVPPSCRRERTSAPLLARAQGREREWTHLDDADVGLLVRLVDRDARDALDPVLDGVRDVRDDLDRLAEVVAPPLRTSVSLESALNAQGARGQRESRERTSFSMTSR